MDKIYGRIYKVTCNVDGKVYIGQTTSSFKRRYDNGGVGVERMLRHYKCCERNNRSYNRHLMFAIEKYGFDAFSVEENFDTAFSKKELDDKERLWIAKLGSSNPAFGYNVELGGNECKEVSATTRKLLSAAQKKRFSNAKNKEYMYSRKQSAETRLKISMSKRGKSGHPMPVGNLGKLNESKRKPVVCITTGETFYYMKDAMGKYGIKSQGSLSLACNGKRKTCGSLPDGSRLQWAIVGE